MSSEPASLASDPQAALEVEWLEEAEIGILLSDNDEKGRESNA